MFSRFIHLPENLKMSLFFSLCSTPLYYMYIFLIHSLVEGHLGSFQVLATTNNAAMNIVEHVLVV